MQQFMTKTLKSILSHKSLPMFISATSQCRKIIWTFC